MSLVTILGIVTLILSPVSMVFMTTSEATTKGEQ